MSTEQVPNFVLSENLQKICEHSQKSALNLAEIRHQNGHGDHMGRSLPQLCSDQPHATFTLRQSESALHFHALALIPIVLSLVSGFTLLGPPQSRAGKTKTFLPGSIWIGEGFYKRFGSRFSAK